MAIPSGQRLHTNLLPVVLGLLGLTALIRETYAQTECSPSSDKWMGFYSNWSLAYYLEGSAGLQVLLYGEKVDDPLPSCVDFYFDLEDPDKPALTLSAFRNGEKTTKTYNAVYEDNVMVMKFNTIDGEEHTFKMFLGITDNSEWAVVSGCSPEINVSGVWVLQTTGADLRYVAAAYLLEQDGYSNIVLGEDERKCS